MEKKSSKPSLIPVFLALLVLTIVAYLMFTDLEPTHVEHDISPSVDLIKTQPITVIPPIIKAPSPEQEAETFVKSLAPVEKRITINEYEDKFVRNDSVIVIPNTEHRTTTKKALLADKSLNSDTPLTLNYTTQDKVVTTLSEISNIIEDETSPITIITPDGTQITSPLAELLHHKDIELSTVITRIIPHEHRIDTTVGALKDIDIAAEQPLTATITHSSQTITLKELTQSESLPDDALFYLHRVTIHDIQGLWGIIQAGLVDKFRRGIALEGITHHKELVQTIIPDDADEKLPSGLSSFLGKILSKKVNKSFVYNLKTRIMGHNANLIFPGQQLILVHFPPDELKQIYLYFSEQQDQNIETFSITN